MKESRILRYWEAFQKVSGVTGEYYLAEQFGYGKQVGDELAELIRIGKKTATTSALELYEKDEPKPKVGTYSIVLDGSGAPVCITQTERVEIKNFNKVTADHAYLEGEENRSLKYWLKGHKDFFEKEYYQAGKVFTDEIPCICETFKVVYK
ncbi:ASCH domain-containing protein [Lactiplantibacillus pentosus]|uniref:ASCH domain-containing protein n=1 Tax=Lactiplantibacillus pentosus TaxID=1589 RepID=UPI003C2979F1